MVVWWCAGEEGNGGGGGGGKYFRLVSGDGRAKAPREVCHFFFSVLVFAFFTMC